LLSAEVVGLIESGCSAIVGTVDPDGLPDAERAWGQWTLRGPERLRFLLPASAARSLANLAAGGQVAFTVTVVDTLQSLQMKGRALVVEPPSRDDRELGDRYVEAFVKAVHETDGTEVALLRNMVPSDYVAVEMTVDAVFDQTPGPTAGRCLS
jgi:hypothetical protein